jgi:large subunit ribosomal protein L19
MSTPDIKEIKPIKNDPEFRSGDTVRVHVKIKEGARERVQMFEGIVLSRRGANNSETFTVRRIGAGGVGIERIWPVNSPALSKIEVLRRGAYRRSKIYFVRHLSARALAAASAAKHTKTAAK